MGRIVEGSKSPSRGLFCFVLCAAFLAGPAAAAGSVRVERISEQVSGDTLDCRIAYPHLTGITDGDGQRKLNVAFLEQANTLRTRAAYEAKSAKVRAKLDFTVTRNSGGVMSLYTKESVDSGGGEKVAQKGVTIDTVTGRRILLSDLFIGNADYVATLNAEVKSQTAKSPAGDFDAVGENAGYYLTAGKLVVLIGQSGNDSDGSAVKEFAIPLKTIEEILKPQFLDTG